MTADTLRAAVAEARAMVAELWLAVSRGARADELFCDRADAVFGRLGDAIEAHARTEAAARPKCDGDAWAVAQRQAGKAQVEMQWHDSVRAMRYAAERAGDACRMADEMMGDTPRRMGRRAMRRMGVAMTAALTTGRTAADGGG